MAVSLCLKTYFNDSSHALSDSCQQAALWLQESDNTVNIDINNSDRKASAGTSCMSNNDRF